MWILYWMTSARRTRFNRGLQRAAELARARGLPLLVVEALDAAPPWATVRTHRFLLQGMLENAAALRAAGAMAWPYAEPEPGAGRGLFEALTERAGAVVTDTFPTLHLPARLAAAKRRFPALEVVDANGLLPLAEGGVFATAMAFRRHLQRTLPAHLAAPPEAEPLHDLPPPVALPIDLAHRWPPLDRLPDLARAAALDGRVGPVADVGGPGAAAARLRRFVAERLDGYADGHNHPDREGCSRLSPHLHAGHLGIHEVFAAVAAHEGWTPARLSGRVTGRREGWWGMSPGAEAFLDEVVTWRELGFQYCHHQPRYAEYDTLPDWARATLEAHAADPRPARYTLRQLEAAETDDEVWNAAQRQLVREGHIHNYLRMLWGKRLLEWTAHPREAFDLLVELNNRWALDGRDPNSYTGIAWTFGRFDRPWGPERPIYGTIRYMSSRRTVEKLELGRWLAAHG